jgi:putative ABC transport system substrate-binding protein
MKVARMMARSVSILVAVAMLAASLQASAQQTNPHVRSVGLLVPNRLDVQNQYPVFVETLRKLGYREGDNLRFVTKEADGKLDRLPSLARELVDARVSVIVAFNTPGGRAAIDATRQIPIVVTQVGDPVGSGFVSNLARPGGNVTGASNLSGVLAPKRMAILKEAVPSAKRFAVLFNPADPITVPQVRDVQSSAPGLGVEVRLFPVRDPQELPATFTQIRAWQAHAAIWLQGQGQLFQAMTIKLAAQHKLPVMVNGIGDVAAGGFISYVADFTEVFRLTAAQVDRILKGTNPGDLPVEQPTKFELAINLRTARMLGLTIPSTVLLRADHVVK